MYDPWYSCTVLLGPTVIKLCTPHYRYRMRDRPQELPPARVAQHSGTGTVLRSFVHIHVVLLLAVAFVVLDLVRCRNDTTTIIAHPRLKRLFNSLQLGCNHAVEAALPTCCARPSPTAMAHAGGGVGEALPRCDLAPHCREFELETDKKIFYLFMFFPHTFH